MSARLPAYLEASAILRLAESQGGYATVLAKGEHDAGTILIVTLCRGASGVLYERMPQRDGSRTFIAAMRENAENHAEFSEYLARRPQGCVTGWPACSHARIPPARCSTASPVKAASFSPAIPERRPERQ